MQVGGHNLTVRSMGDGQIALSWVGGATQTAYQITRVTPGGSTTIPVPGGAHGWVDTLAPADRWACYTVIPLRNGQPIAISDALCARPWMAIGASAQQIGVSLNQGNSATLSWAGPRPPSGYLLVALGDSQPQLLPASASSTSHETLGVFRCYVILGQDGSTIASISDTVCAAPGRSVGLADRRSEGAR